MDILSYLLSLRANRLSPTIISDMSNPYEVIFDKSLHCMHNLEEIIDLMNEINYILQ